MVDVSNGDAITVLHDGMEERIFLYGINCPRQQQNFGPESKKFTFQTVLGRIVEVRPLLVDGYGRTIAIVSIGGVSLNDELVRAGLAWVLVQYCREASCSNWIRSQEEAQAERIGLWSNSNPSPPSELRRENRPPENTLPDSSRSKRKSAEASNFHGNIVTHIFHASGCKDYECPKCIAHFKTRDAALRAGYKPCEVCNP